MSLANKKGHIWFDGKMVNWEDATVHVLSHALHYGTSIFEGVRCYKTGDGPALFRLAEHTRRLFHSAHIIGMQIPFSPGEISAAQCQAILANNLDAGYVRPLAFYGANSLGISAKDNPVHVAVAAWEWGAYLGEESLTKGIRVKTSSFSRLHVNANMCRAKVGGHYVNSVLANDEVTRNGYDEALLLDINGLVAEGAGENIFMVRGGVIYTPILTSALGGITRDAIFTLAADLGLEVRETQITRDDLYCADEAFFAGTAVEITPIREIDDRRIGDGRRGQLTTALQRSFFDTVKGRGKRSPEWLTPAAAACGDATCGGATVAADAQ